MSTSSLAFLLVTLLAGTVRSSHWISIKPAESHEELDFIRRDTVDRCTGPGSLDFSRAGLTSIPDRFIRATCITSISLEGNMLEAIPKDAFSELPNLECLNLAGNRIPSNRYTTYDHERLKTLILSNQQVSHVPDGPESLDMDRYVGNDFSITFGLIDSSIPVFPNLEYLDLSGSDFQDIPKYFNLSFPRLNRLDLTNRGITDIFEDVIHKLPKTMKSLHLENNDLREIYFPYTAGIESLYLDGNPLEPSGIHVLSTMLKVLSLSNCTLRTVAPESFDHLPNIVTLDLSHNHLDALPEALKPLQNLEELNLSHNRLRTFPDLSLHPRLRSLELSYNGISDLTISYAVPLPSLQRLCLRGNRISAIDVSAFAGMPDLRELNLGENLLSKLPVGWMYPTRGLRYLDLEYNRFASIADMAIDSASGLTDLFVRSNANAMFDTREILGLPEKCVVHVV